MTDHEAIGRLVAAYCHRLDDGEWDEFAALWTEDAVLVIGDTATTGRDAIREAVSAAQTPERRGRHLTANLEVDVDGDRATGRSDFQFWVRSPDGALKLARLGRYRDEIVRTGDGWRFARREIQFF